MNNSMLDCEGSRTHHDPGFSERPGIIIVHSGIITHRTNIVFVSVLIVDPLLEEPLFPPGDKGVKGSLARHDRVLTWAIWQGFQPGKIL